MQSVAMRKSAEVRTRIEPGLKEQSTEVLAGLGLDMSDAIRLFLRQVVAVQGLPFDLRKPSAKTIEAMIEARGMAQARFGSAKDLFDAIEKNPGKGKARHIAEKV
jgi:DNA-damage-inducible protein J